MQLLKKLAQLFAHDVIAMRRMTFLKGSTRAAFLSTICEVICLSTKPKVRWVAAGWVITFVANDLIRPNLSDQQ